MNRLSLATVGPKNDTALPTFDTLCQCKLDDWNVDSGCLQRMLIQKAKHEYSAILKVTDDPEEALRTAMDTLEEAILEQLDTGDVHSSSSQSLQGHIGLSMN